jgi:methionyl-tRNA synthetase
MTNPVESFLKIKYPKRAIVTAGMPYGNKDLHFGHVGGMIVHADVFARFLRNRLGKENVLFLSGTDCYGSPIVESHRLLVQQGKFSGNLEDFVKFYHGEQKETLSQYHISFNLFSSSGIGNSAINHQKTCAELFGKLKQNEFLFQRSSEQFYDAKSQAWLNGRQVLGKCPVPGCKSEKAYADECGLGHPYDPKELIQPMSSLSGTTPELRKVVNWHVKSEFFKPWMEKWLQHYQSHPGARPGVVSGVQEFLEPPSIYIKKDNEPKIPEIQHLLPKHQVTTSKNQAMMLVFENLEDREKAGALLDSHEIRYRMGKTIVPLRLTGNVEWGVPVPEESKGTTFWVWPESLWAPISFCKEALEKQGNNASQAWEAWWKSPETEVFQFIGEDNLYFYALAEGSLFLGDQSPDSIQYPCPKGSLQLPHLVVNNHILYFDKKASSSAELKPPLARELLKWYTPDQLRAHFLSLSLGHKSVSFKPKPFDPKAGPKDADPVLKEGNLLCNALNKVIKSCFYYSHKFYEGKLPQESVGTEVKEQCRQAILRYDELMYSHEFNQVMHLLDTFIRDINKYLTVNLKVDSSAESLSEPQKQALADSFHLMRTALVLIQPIAPEGSALTLKFLNLDESFWNWDKLHLSVAEFAGNPQHLVDVMPQREDFFPKHPTQLHFN